MRLVASFSFFACAFLCLALAGCGYPRTDVTGAVTYNGKPIKTEGGTISFFGPDGVPVTAKIDTEGNYQAVGVCTGENKVAVNYQRPVRKPANKRVPRQDVEHVTVNEGSPFLIPDEYIRPDTSGLTVTIDRGTVYSPKLVGPEPE